MQISTIQTNFRTIRLLASIKNWTCSCGKEFSKPCMKIKIFETNNRKLFEPIREIAPANQSKKARPYNNYHYLIFGQQILQGPKKSRRSKRSFISTSSKTCWSCGKNHNDLRLQLEPVAVKNLYLYIRIGVLMLGKKCLTISRQGPVYTTSSTKSKDQYRNYQ